MRFALYAAFLLAPALSLFADGIQDNDPANVRRIPPLGIEVPEADKQALQALIANLRAELEAFDPNAPQAEYLPDVEVLIRGVEDPLTHQEIQKAGEIDDAYQLLDLASQRLDHLKVGEAPWTQEKGLVVRGFVSKLDGSVQPYGLVIPESYEFAGDRDYRLDFWFHGRGEKATELTFLNQRLSNAGQYQPEDTIVLHPYARYSNGNKFAGEIDCLEALEHVRSQYRIDENRILVRGFSMGGAACWNFAVHYADRWAAANPGAGYSETPEFLKSFQEEELNPTWYEEKLWHLYDCTDYAINLFNLPTVAYSGEIDRQKQAADIMADAMEEEGLSLTHIIGPETAHKIHPDSKIEIEKRLDSIASIGRNPMPPRIRFTTWTLRYNRMFWVTVDALKEHWNRARLDVDITGPSTVKISRIENVSAFTFEMPAGRCILDPLKKPTIVIGYQEIEAPRPGSDRSWKVQLRLEGKRWEIVDPNEPEDEAADSEETEEEAPVLAKRHGLQGPIDDAFMDSFLFVTPTGVPANPALGEFVQREQERAVTHWRQQFRGQVRQKPDSQVTPEDIAEHNLILWGDYSSNKVIAQILEKLPIQWSEDGLVMGEKTLSEPEMALLMIYPNPLNPDKYVVLNSSFTYREYDYLNNARQVPKLPDWAIIDARTPGTSRGPGEVVDAGFFDEAWQLK